MYCEGTKYNHNRWSHSRKFKFYFLFIYLFCELCLILVEGGENLKSGSDILRRTLDIEFERDRSIDLGSTFGDGQTDTHTDIFLKQVF